MLKAYKYRLYPTLNQTELLEKHFGCVRLVFNRALALKKESYENSKLDKANGVDGGDKPDNKPLSCYDIKKLIPEWKLKLPFLKEVNSLSIQQSVLNLDIAYRKFYKKEAGYPK
jgi:putative transposase